MPSSITLILNSSIWDSQKQTKRLTYYFGFKQLYKNTYYLPQFAVLLLYISAFPAYKIIVKINNESSVR
jgi:hypothetical protein